MHRAGDHAETVLVAGGAGFLGAQLCSRLLEDGHTVICLDNFLTGSRANVAHLRREDDFTLIEHDIIRPLPANLRPTRIYNLACAASPPHYQADPVHTLLTNVQGAYHLLELAAHTGATILQASTSEIYGEPQIHPQPESYRGNVSTTGVRACYDEGKRCAETLFSDYARKGSARTRIARIFNTYGPGMSPQDGRVVSNFMMQALAGRPLTIYGDGMQTRSLCYVDDLIEGLVRLMENEANMSQPVNLGNTEEITVLAIAQRICRLLDREPNLMFLALPGDDPSIRCPDISLARSVLGWQPRVSLDIGLARTLAYFSSRLDAGADAVVNQPRIAHRGGIV